jgi:hypothetical protein
MKGKPVHRVRRICDQLVVRSIRIASLILSIAYAIFQILKISCRRYVEGWRNTFWVTLIDMFGSHWRVPVVVVSLVVLQTLFLV